MRKNERWYIICISVIACIFLNYAGKMFGERLELPLWLDSFGTVLIAYLLGPVCGAVVGISLNIVYGVLYSYTYIIYGSVSLAIGVIVGICAKRRWFEHLFGTLSVGFLLTVVSVTVSVPCNYIFFDGQIENVWGDGIIALFTGIGINSLVSHIAGQFYIDFLDKVLMCLCLYFLIKLSRKIREKGISKKSGRRKPERLVSALLVMALAGQLMSAAGVVSYAAEEGSIDFDRYVQTIYNNDNGLPGGKANDIAQTTDGVLWIGTYGGLYRYNGSQFTLMDNFESVKNANCLYTDEAGRLWIGTNDSGLSICINDNIANVLDVKDGLGADSVRCITQGADGRYYVGTTGSLSVVTLSGGLSVETNIEEIVYAYSVSADAEGNVAVVTDDGMLYLVRDTEVVAKYQDKENGFTCCRFAEDGSLYVGTASDKMIKYAVKEDGLVEKKTIRCQSLSEISSITIQEGIVYLCAYNGAGYLDQNDRCHEIKMNQFNSSLEHMLIDYQGNYWFASSRLGLLRMCQSVFTDINVEAGLDTKVVNSTAYWQGDLYIGMDEGLAVVDGDWNREIENAWTKELEGVRIRNLMVDSRDDLWVATAGKGVYQISPNGSLRVYDETVNANGQRFRSLIELEDGTIMASGDSGITYIKDGTVTGTLGSADGLENTKLLCLLECADGSVLAGSDGAGIYRIQDGKVTGHYSKEDGLSSGVVMRLVASLQEDGVFIVTSNSLSYMDADGMIREFTNFPYYNNFDVVERQDGTLFVLGSAGIYVVDKQTLFDGGELEYKLLNAKMGLQKSLTPNSWNYLDEHENLYLSTDTGVVKLNLNQYDVATRSYRMYVKSIKVDDAIVKVERGEPTILERGVSRIEIVPEVVNYSVNDPYVSVWLEGFDKEPKIVRQSELTNIVYTNLSTNTYIFHLAVLDSKGQSVLAESTYTIEKEKEIYDYWWFRLYAIFVFALAMFYMAWLLIRTQIQRTIAMQKRELELAKNQIEMGNETVLTIARTVDAKDENTSQHSMRVSEYSVLIAKRLGFTEEQCETLRKTALLHDIGKIGIPDRVLNKPSKLDDEEYEIMKSHVVKGAEILKKFTLIDNVQEGALYHHERYDGRGYVHGLKGEEIPLNARIIGIADAFDAMTANRVYRKKLDFGFVLGELKKGRGTQFDPKLVDIMLSLIEEGVIDVSKLYEPQEKRDPVNTEAADEGSSHKKEEKA
ncbi:HD domain-containing phosphohydrolase [Eubacterium sp. MSJ-33]|uniref:HD domain-containing phosphohydrolase n=1 Tax=Eubacterium sp. MSJ-33 TaxID=2841528 RepID=UPI001C7918F8|nr:HD domain-containing phosphohydrolase [Eubacterium sp. MSJ-33]QWT52426.1 HD domain-containing protein [Eubacterium sp. MSJ-33]